jgi:hypothetical protein
MNHKLIDKSIKNRYGLLKLSAHRAGLPGNELVYFLLRPLSYACKAGLAGALPFKQGGNL